MTTRAPSMPPKRSRSPAASASAARTGALANERAKSPEIGPAGPNRYGTQRATVTMDPAAQTERPAPWSSQSDALREDASSGLQLPTSTHSVKRPYRRGCTACSSSSTTDDGNTVAGLCELNREGADWKDSHHVAEALIFKSARTRGDAGTSRGWGDEALLSPWRLDGDAWALVRGAWTRWTVAHPLDPFSGGAYRRVWR